VRLPAATPADLQLPNANAIAGGIPLFSLPTTIAPTNCLHSEQTLNIQWQAAQRFGHRNWYVGISAAMRLSLRLNQAKIASPSAPLLAGTPFEQDYTYGYSVMTDPASFTAGRFCPTDSPTS